MTVGRVQNHFARQSRPAQSGPPRYSLAEGADIGLHLVIARQTAGSEELLEAVLRVADSDPEASFAILLPETPLQHLHMVSAGTAQALALEAAEEVRRRFVLAGVRVATVKVTDPNPVVAAEQELAASPYYAGIIVATFPPGLSRWLKLDVVSRLRRISSLPVMHVVAAAGKTWARGKD